MKRTGRDLKNEAQSSINPQLFKLAPIDIWKKIIWLMNAKDLGSFAQICKGVEVIINDFNQSCEEENLKLFGHYACASSSNLLSCQKSIAHIKLAQYLSTANESAEAMLNL